MNYELKRPKLIPLAILLNLSIVVFPFGQLKTGFLDTFVVGSLTMLLLFGKEDYKQLFCKMKTSIWFPVSVWFFTRLGCMVWGMIWMGIFGNMEQFIHAEDNIASSLPTLFDKLLWFSTRMFSAVNEELMFIPILLTFYLLMKKDNWRSELAWYSASFCTGIIFAMLHFKVYQLDGGIFISILATRMVLNETFKKCQSINGPMIVHFLFDLSLIFYCF